MQNGRNKGVWNFFPKCIKNKLETIGKIPEKFVTMGGLYNIIAVLKRL